MIAFFQTFFTFDRWLFGVCFSVVSGSQKRMCWTQTGEAICNTHFHKKKKKVALGNANFKRCLSLFPRPSILYYGFHLHLILPLQNQRKMKTIFWFLHGLPSVTIHLNSTSRVSEAFTHIVTNSQPFIFFFSPFPLSQSIIKKKYAKLWAGLSSITNAQKASSKYLNISNINLMSRALC